jgi:hypothetical protein
LSPNIASPMKIKSLKKEIEESLEFSLNQVLFKLNISQPTRKTRKLIRKSSKEIFTFLKDEYKKEIKKLAKEEKVLEKKVKKEKVKDATSLKSIAR